MNAICIFKLNAHLIPAVTIVQVLRARTDPRRARNHRRGTDLVRAAPHIDTNTIHDEEAVTLATRIRARPDDDIFLCNSKIYLARYS